jgi:hypothetical protein
MDATSRVDIRPADHDERLAAAIARSRYELGDGTWARRLVGAYLWPDGDRDALKREEEGDV